MGDWDSKADLKWVDAGSYQWTQSMSDVQLRLPVELGTRGRSVKYKLTATSLSIACNGVQLIEGALFDRVVPDESLWTLQEEEGRLFVEVVMLKQREHESWASVVRGGPQMDPVSKKELEEKMMLEKMQRKHPGFDFSGAEFSGQLPKDPKTFGDDWGRDGK